MDKIYEGYPDGYQNVFGKTAPIELADYMSHYIPNNLLTPAKLSTKTAKSVELFGDKFDFYVLYIAPARLVSGVNFCKGKSLGCEKACLYTAGRGRFTNIQNARINKGKYLRDETDVFLWQLANEIDKAIVKAKKKNKKAVFRLNGTTDINWPKLLIDFFGDQFYSERPDAIFYEYTKDISNILWSAVHNIPIHYTFSRSEANDKVVKRVNLLSPDTNIAVVFQKDLPETFNGRPVIDGDTHDARFVDPSGCIVGLRAKGAAKKDTSGFTVPYVKPLKIAG